MGMGSNRMRMGSRMGSYGMGGKSKAPVKAGKELGVKVPAYSLQVAEPPKSEEKLQLD